MQRNTALTLTVATGVLLGVGEVAQIFMIAAPAMAGIFALLFFGGAFLARTKRMTGVVVIGVLALLELLFLPVYDRKTASDWVVQGVFAVVSLIAAVAAAMVLIRQRRSRSAGLGKTTVA